MYFLESQGYMVNSKQKNSGVFGEKSVSFVDPSHSNDIDKILVHEKCTYKHELFIHMSIESKHKTLVV